VLLCLLWEMFQSIDRHGFERATLHDVLEDSPQGSSLYLGEMIEELGSTDFWRFWVVHLWVEDLAVASDALWWRASRCVPTSNLRLVFPKSSGARITVRTKDQRVLVKEHIGYEGGLDNPLVLGQSGREVPLAERSLRRRRPPK